jgi:hypothetical protein
MLARSPSARVVMLSCDVRANWFSSSLMISFEHPTRAMMQQQAAVKSFVVFMISVNWFCLQT